MTLFSRIVELLTSRTDCKADGATKTTTALYRARIRSAGENYCNKYCNNSNRPILQY